MKLLNSSANGIIHKIGILLEYLIEIIKHIAICVDDVLEKLSHFNFSDWQIMHTTLSL